MNGIRTTWIGMVFAILTYGGGSLAASYTFTGSSDNLWTNKLSWTPNSAYPGQNDDVTFSDSSPDNALTNGSATSVSVRNVTFSRTSNFTIPYGNWALQVYGTNVTASGGVVYSNVPNANVGSMTAGLRLMGDQTWNVDAGTVVAVTSISTAYGGAARLTKTGAGDLVLNGGGGYYGGLYLDVEDGKLVYSGGNSRLTTRGLVGPGAFEVYLSGGDGYGGYGVAPVSDQVFSGPIRLWKTANLWWIVQGNTNTWTLRGNGNVSLTSAGTTSFRIINGTVELDYSQPGESGKDRIATNIDIGFISGVLRVTGSTEGDVNEAVGLLSSAGFDQASSTTMGGIGNVVVNHGNGRTAKLSFLNTAAFVTNNGTSLSGYGPLHLRFAGTNLTTGADDLGSASKVMFGGAGVVPAVMNGILGGYAYVGPEFAAYDHGGGSGQGVIALSASGRPSDLNTANGHVLTTGDVPQPASAKTVASLKFTGNHALNLNGQTLTILSGGVIQSGANNTQGITNGTLKAGNGTLYLNTDKDLTIAPNVTITANAVSKIGEGKLTMWAAPAGPLFWNEGSLEYRNDSDVSIRGANYYGPGFLLKAGTGTMSIAQYSLFNHSGGTVIENGALKPYYADYAVPGDIGNRGPITIGAAGKLWIIKPKTFTGIALGGSGTIMANAALDGSGASNAFTLAGCAVRPGGDNAVGQLSVNTSTLTFSKNGTNFCTLAIDVTGSGCDQLYVTGPTVGAGKVAGIEAAAANRTVDLVVRVRPGVNTAGPLTILSAPNANFTGKAFNSVTWELQGSSGIVNYLNGSITLTNVKSPSGSLFVVR